MTSREEIALLLTRATIEKINFTTSDVKTLPYEIYNSIYDNLNYDKADDYPIL